MMIMESQASGAPNCKMVLDLTDGTTISREDGNNNKTDHVRTGLSTVGGLGMNRKRANLSDSLKLSIAKELFSSTLSKKKPTVKGPSVERRSHNSDPFALDGRSSSHEKSSTPPSSSSSMKKSSSSILRSQLSRVAQGKDGRQQQNAAFKTTTTAIITNPEKGSHRKGGTVSETQVDDSSSHESDIEEYVVAVPAVDESIPRRRAPPARTSSMKKGGGSRLERVRHPPPPMRSASLDQLNQAHGGSGARDSRNTLTRNRSITFNETVKVKRIPSAAQLIDGKTDDLWFQQDEYETIKRKTMALIRAIQKKETGGVTYCTRGLEKYFKVEEVQQKRASTWESVLYEQELQRSAGSFDDMKLCRAARKFTRLSTVEAEERGKQDEDAIDRYVKRTREICRTYSMPNTAFARK